MRMTSPARGGCPRCDVRRISTRPLCCWAGSTSVRRTILLSCGPTGTSRTIRPRRTFSPRPPGRSTRLNGPCRAGTSHCRGTRGWSWAACGRTSPTVLRIWTSGCARAMRGTPSCSCLMPSCTAVCATLLPESSASSDSGRVRESSWPSRIRCTAWAVPVSEHRHRCWCGLSRAIPESLGRRDLRPLANDLGISLGRLEGAVAARRVRQTTP